MHKVYHYMSVFANPLTDYITAKREAGFMYDNPAYWLYRFDQFCIAQKVSEAVVTKPLFDAWAVRSDKETKTTQNNRLQALRNFCVYLNTMGITAYIPVVLPKPEKVIPYLMHDEDIRAFFEQVDLYEKKILDMSDPTVMLQGEFIFTYRLTCRLKAQGIKVVAACSERRVVEETGVYGELVRKSQFAFVKFAEY